MRAVVVIYAFVTVLCSVSSLPTDSAKTKKPFSRLDCNYYSLTCLKMDMVSWISQLEQEDTHSVLPGVNIVKLDNVSAPSDAEVVKEIAKKFPDDPKSRLDAYLLQKVSRYVTSRSIKVGFEEDEETNEVETGRKKKGGDGGAKKKILALALLKTGLIALALKKIALIAGKALLTGGLAFLIAAGIGLKSLLAKKQHTTSYEVVAHPVYSYGKTHSVSHHHGHPDIGHHDIGHHDIGHHDIAHHDIGHYGASGGEAYATSGHGDYGLSGHGGWGRSGPIGLPPGLKPGYKPPQ